MTNCFGKTVSLFNAPGTESSMRLKFQKIVKASALLIGCENVLIRIRFKGILVFTLVTSCLLLVESSVSISFSLIKNSITPDTIIGQKTKNKVTDPHLICPALKNI